MIDELAVRSATISSELIASLFPPGVTASERREPGNPGMLLEAEAAASRSFAPKRVAEFSAGRDCARHALRALGCGDVAIPRRTDRRPEWPIGFVGSITHTIGFCGAVAASAASIAALGIDAELSGRLTSDMWSHLFVDREMKALLELAPRLRERTAAVMFGAKEAFYKCQSPRTGMWIDFDEVAVDVRFANESVGSFALRLESDACIARFGACDLRGNFRFEDDLVVTGMHVEIGAPGW